MNSGFYERLLFYGGLVMTVSVTILISRIAKRWLVDLDAETGTKVESGPDVQ